MNGRMHMTNLPEINPIISATGCQGCFIGTLLIKIVRTMQIVRPEFFSAYAVAFPALHGPPRRRSGIVFSRPFIIAAGKFIKHARTDATLKLTLMEQEIDHCRKGKTRARAFRALIKNGWDSVDVNDLVG